MIKMNQKTNIEKQTAPGGWARGRNFTLIELLVVVSIIAILASLLLPALNKARNQAKTIKCVNSIKTLSSAFMQYTLDNGDYFPWYSQWNNPGSDNKTDWPYVLKRTYLTPNNIVNNEKTWGAVMCPSRPGGGGMGVWIHYGYNHLNIGSNSNKVPSPLTNQASAPAKISSLQKSSTVILAADCTRYTAANYGDGYCLMNDHPLTGTDHPFAIHDGYANVAWCDGHVSKIKGIAEDPASTYAVLGNRLILGNNWTRDGIKF